jgi:hypothetical protein
MLRFLIALALLLVLSYGLIEAWPLIQGPALTIDSPVDQGVYPGGSVTIRGHASRIADLTLNGATVIHDTQGTFDTTLTFPRGGSILTFVATDRFGRRLTLTRSVYIPD